MRFSLILLVLTLGSSCLGFLKPVAESDDQTAKETASPFRIMTDAREKQYRSLFPQIDSEELSAILNDPATLLYSELEIPKAYQFWDGALPGVHSVQFNISADASEPYGNGNIEFPWGSPAGVHRAPNVETFKFLSLPKDEQGKRLPVVWYPHLHRGDPQRGYAWVFPIGTVVGECLLMRDPGQQMVMFELRIRRRTRRDWEVDVFRPFTSDQQLSDAIKDLRPAWSSDPETKRLVEHLESNDRLVKKRLTDRHPVQSFDQSMGVDVLPNIDDKLATELLKNTVFRSAHGSRWSENESGLYTVAPTTNDNFHVIPRNFDGGFIDVDETSCLRCHETVGKHVQRFESFRDWYGRIRGSDGIFSFHPFSPGSISYNGQGGSVTIRSDFVKAGIVEQYDPSRHSKKDYRRLTFIGE